MTTRVRRPVLQATAIVLTFAMILHILPIAAVNAAGIRPAEPNGQGSGTGDTTGHEEVLLGDTASTGYVPGELIVRLKDDAAKGPNAQGQTAGRGALQGEGLLGDEDGGGLTVDGLLSAGEDDDGLSGNEGNSLHLLTLPDGADMEQVLETLRQDPDVLYAEPNYIFAAQEDPPTPNDPRIDDQWALAEIRALSGWATADTLLGGAEGTPVTVAVVDTGVDYQHDDLRDRMATGPLNGYNAFTDATGQAAAADDSANSHGTRVAGLIAAEANNGIGIAGVAGNLPVSILPVKALDQHGYGTMLQVASGIRWAADHGARVINLSLGARLSDFPATLADAVRYAQDKGVLIVAAAGNDALQYGGSVQGFYPACLPGVVAVSATTADQKPAAFSNVGDGVMAAPGVDVLSTIRDDGDELDDDYGTSAGTSFAAPVVSGIAAAILSVYPDRTSTEVASTIHSGAEDAWYYNDEGNYRTFEIADLPGALGGTPNPGDYLTMLEPSEGAVLSGTVTISVVATNPDNVHHIDFLVRAHGDYELVVGRVDGPLVTGQPAGSGVYSVQWDTTGETLGVPDGVYSIDPCLYTSESGGDIYGGAMVTVLNNEEGGLSLQIKKPLEGTQTEPQNAAFASVVIAHATVDDSGALTTELVWRGVTDGDGGLLVPRAVATHGNDYLVMVNGTDPGFLYVETLRSPGAYTLTAENAHKVSLTAVTAEGTSLAGAAVRADVLRGNVPGAEDPGDRLIVPRKDRWDEGEDIFLAGYVNGQGVAEFYVSPGSYDFSVMDHDRMCFLLKRGVEISGDYTSSFGAAQDLVQVVLVPDPEAGFDEYSLTVSDGDRQIHFPDPGSRVVTLSKDLFDLEVTAVRRNIEVGGLDYDYTLGLSRTIDASSAASPIQFNFGRISEATVVPISNGDPEADPPELRQFAQAEIDYHFHDSHGNRATALYRQRSGDIWADELDFTLTFKDPDGATIETVRRYFGYEASWNPPHLRLWVRSALWICPWTPAASWGRLQPTLPSRS